MRRWSEVYFGHTEMGRTMTTKTKRAKITVGTEIEPVKKYILLEELDAKGKEGTSHHNSKKVAYETDRMPRPIGNGSRMGCYNAEAAARFLGREQFNRTGIVDMHFGHPWFSGETMTVTGRVSDIRPEGDGQRVTIDMRVENQDGVRCGLGICSAVVPNSRVK